MNTRAQEILQDHSLQEPGGKPIRTIRKLPLDDWDTYRRYTEHCTDLKWEDQENQQEILQELVSEYQDAEAGIARTVRKHAWPESRRGLGVGKERG